MVAKVLGVILLLLVVHDVHSENINEACDSVLPECRKSGGSCISKRDDVFQCICPGDSDFQPLTGCIRGPPKVKDSFIAWGEINEPVPDTNNLMVLQTSFEESYDASTKNAAFFLWLAGQNLTFVKNYETNQTFLYVEIKGTKLQCLETTEKEWTTSDFGPPLLSFESHDTSVKFSLAQLFDLPEDYLKGEEGVKTKYRGIPAKSWTYEIKTKDEDGNQVTLSIQSFWSDGSWNTSSGKEVTPLGFNVSKMTWLNPTVIENYVINVFGFVHDAYDHKYFEPVQGVVCPNRKSTIKFPNVQMNTYSKAISLHSEVVFPDYQEIRYQDTWLDAINQLARVDIERMKNEDPMERKTKQFQSEIAIGKLGVVYRWIYFNGASRCEIKTFDEYESDLQNLVDIKQSVKDHRDWRVGKIFGLNDTSYVYIGQTTKNDVPCQLFQGIRFDWPDKDSKIASLWEWCFNVDMINSNDAIKFNNDELGLINANVIVLADSKGTFDNFSMNHHFYEVRARDPKILQATTFDIGRCFSDQERMPLQFYLDIKINNDNKLLFENATNDVNFLQIWNAVLYRYTKLEPYSLRISKVRATIAEDNLMYIKFSILDVHKGLPEDVKKGQISSLEAQKNLKKSIDARDVTFHYSFNKESMKIAALPDSLSFQIDPSRFDPQTIPPPTTTTTVPTTPLHITLIIDPDEKTKSTENDSVAEKVSSDAPTIKEVTRTTQSSGSTSTNSGDDATTPPTENKREHIVKMTGHQPGAVAGVSIAMLLVGISIGAGGTFYKFNGLPECMRR